MNRDSALIYITDDSAVVRSQVADVLTAEGFRVHLRGAETRSTDTKSMGRFLCALVNLQPADEKQDAVDLAEILRVYRPGLPVAFLHVDASPRLRQRANALGPVFRKPDEFQNLLIWVRRQAGG
jgi:DNA-binding response OmpR family regulator